MPGLAGTRGAPGDLARDLLRRCAFPAAGSAVTLAVSGGPDSLALLILASTAGLDATAVHVDHRIRPDSARESVLVASIAAKYSLRFEAREVIVEPGPDLEARARSARYRVLPAGVMTGHTMDDQAETVLLNLLRGAGLDGLAGMRSPGSPAGGGRPCRPLLALRRSETEGLCAAEGVEVFRDPSNDDPRFRRNRVRAEVIPLLSGVAGRDVVPVLARQAELLRADADLLDQLAGAVDPTDSKALNAAPVATARRAVRRWLRSGETGGDPEMHPPSAAEIARVLDVASGAVTACELAGGRRVARSSGRLRIDGR